MTGEELARRPDLNPCELVNGRVVPMAPAGHIHGEVESRLDVELALYARKTGSGRVLVGEVGIYTGRDPDTVRGADIVFMSHERHARRGPSVFLDVAPELVVEILSPEDRPGQVNDKIREYLAAGVDRIWFVNPRRRSVLVYRSSGQVEALEVGDTLRDEEILPASPCLSPSCSRTDRFPRPAPGCTNLMSGGPAPSGPPNLISPSDVKERAPAIPAPPSDAEAPD